MHTRKFILIFVAVIVLAVVLGTSVYFQGVLLKLTDVFGRFANENPLVSKFLFIALAAASVLIGPFSSAPLVPLAIAVWSVPLTILLTLVGWMVGDFGAYAIGRYAGRPIVSFLVGRERFKRWMDLIHPRMRFSLLLLFRLAMPAETGYLFGTLAYSFWKYIIITLIAEVPLVLLVVYAGDALLLRDWVTFGTFVFVGICAIVFMFQIFSRHFRDLKS